MGEEIDVESRTITMHLETRGSRKALGAINAKLRAKVGRLERDLSAALTTAECADNYAKMFEDCVEDRDQQAQRIGELEGLLRATGEAGRQLSNAAYNLAQREGHELTKYECELLSSLRKQWDSALSAGKEGE